MTGRLIVDLDENGLATISTLAGDGGPPSVAGRAALSWPLHDEALEDLRWYLEDYLVAPFGVYEDRGTRIAESLGKWGKAVFSAVFGSGPAQDAYAGIRARGDVEVVFRSSSPSLLGLPWELMADPASGRPLVLEVAGVSRALPTTSDTAQTAAVPGGRLRVLMVISRPTGTGDVGYRMIARPLLERLEAVRGSVDLVVLRPPTLDALRAELASAATEGRPYQVVHFDGHGVLPGQRSGANGGVTFGTEGMLVFERPDGGAYRASASRVAQVLAEARVPVVVLNACQSGAVGKELEAAVATRLLGEGIASVVAMAYRVYALAAAEFMAAFYETLFAGGTVAAAVTAGRLQMWHRSGRPSPKGDLPLEDWLVPVHYFRREVRFPQAAVSRRPELPSLAQALEEVSAVPGETSLDDLDAANGVFVGRDSLFYDLEAAARQHKVVVLTGPGGTGKTELAKAFARWWRDTGGVERPEWVFWHSFEPGVATFGLDGVIGEIGLRLYGEQFALQEAGQRRAAVLKALAEQRMLLVWDNFESVRSMPSPGHATPPLDEAGCDELREFLATVAAAEGSSVLVTSRTAETWLDGSLGRVTAGGLAPQEAAEYAEILLACYPAAQQRRQSRAFGDLMQWLDGHPLSLRLVLPGLDSDSPEGLLAGLQGITPLPGHAAAGMRSLQASVAYSYAHLSPEARRLLPAVSLSNSVAEIGVLEAFSQDPHVPERFAGATRDEWIRTLDEATRVGLLTRVEPGRSGRFKIHRGTGGMYKIHPALPGYLAAAWEADKPSDYSTARTAATKAFLNAHVALSHWLSEQIHTGNAGLAYAFIEEQRRTLGHLLSHALDHELWGEAHDILAPLYRYWDARGLHAEAIAWSDRVRAATVTTAGAPPADTPAGKLWTSATYHQARCNVLRHQLDRAESALHELLSALHAAAPTSPHLHHNMGNIYHELGAVALARGDFRAAEGWYRKSLAIEEKLGNQSGVAITYQDLGRLAQERGDFRAAKDWYRKSLAIKEKLGDQAGLANIYHHIGWLAHQLGDLPVAEDCYRKSFTFQKRVGNQLGLAEIYHHLGILAQERGDFLTAEGWYRKSLAIKEKLGDQPGLASTYHHLGTLAKDSGDFPMAESWYRKSLAIEEKLGNRPGLAGSYQQLGIVAQERGDFLTAEGWYRKSLAIKEKLGDQPGLARTYGQLSLLAEDRGHLTEALTWMVRCVSLFDEFPHPATGHGPGYLAHLTGRLGIAALERAWREVTSEDLPQAVRHYVTHGLQGEGDMQ